MNTQKGFLAELASLLADSQIPFMVSGSVASSYYGVPRTTNDFDLVIDPAPNGIEQFLKAVRAAWYVSPEAAREALRRRSMFNVIDVESGWKADLVIRKDRPYSVEEFRRRLQAEVMGVQVPVVTPEDSILSKLEWAKESESEHQYQDVLQVARTNRAQLDIAYLNRWAIDLGVDQALSRLLKEAAESAS